MSPKGVRARLQGEGFRLSLVGPDGLKVEPASKLTPDSRALIQAHRAAIVALLREPEEIPPELRRLIERVSEYFNASADELAVILKIAARDPAAARESFEDSARRGWVV